jgi:ribosomal-protein-alanine N-acetyltransferase
MVETKRLILRKFMLSDVKDYHQILKNRSVYEWLGKGAEKTEEQVKKIIKYDLDHWENHQLGTWAVILKETNELIGHCGFGMIKAHNQYELLYAFSPEFWGKGYATEAGKASLKWLKNHTSIKSIIALSYPNNQRSIHVIEKLGFTYQKKTHLFGVDLYMYQLSIE